jgi:hypothetical protein
VTARDAINIVKRVFPKATDERAIVILWTHTGFPGFWRGNPAKEIAESMRALKRHIRNGRQMCDFCNKAARRKNTLCSDCERAWQKRDKS